MMAQYMEAKETYKDCILMFRLGDFYEMFFEDALVASKALEITLTGRECGLEERAPMCGVPHHSVDNYVNRLVQKGYKVAIAEQMEDPALAKGLVRREVTQVVTPGTITSAVALDESKHNYLMGVAYVGGVFGVAVTDISTGDFLVTQAEGRGELLDEIYRFAPSELVCNEAFAISGVDLEETKSHVNLTAYTLETRFFDPDACYDALRGHFHTATTDGLGLGGMDPAAVAAGGVLLYLYETKKSALPHIAALEVYRTAGYMVIDTSTRRNLELTETMREKQKKGSLLGVLDKTKTAMGARMLRSFIEQPLIKKGDILRRQEAVQALWENHITREEIREYLNPIYDMERLLGRISCQSAGPRDMLAFQKSLEMLPHIKALLTQLDAPLVRDIDEKMDPLEDVCALICEAIAEDAPVSAKDGGVIRDGYHEETDRLRQAKIQGKGWLADLEAREREKTGIKNLKIKYSHVFGYNFEVSNANRALVPEYFVRRQTLTNAERYTTGELKKLEDDILGAEERLLLLEYELFCEVREQVASHVKRIQDCARAVAALDCLASLAAVAQQNSYVRPDINEEGRIAIKDGRHPVVEKMIRDELFVANDTHLDRDAHRISIITGPNMAGKSTYMRQVALIVLMAQMGGFVPASSANIGICDRVFTRVGASDDLSSGQSTFMVEMTEVANILRSATRNSLLILDEIGRGTSTFDGLAIAWAVVEHIGNGRVLGAKTLFATHYHELTELEGSIPGVNNYCIAVKERGDAIVFLRKIVRGGADKSYGIQVAKLAGVPDAVIERAKELVAELANADITVKAKEIAAKKARARRKDVRQLSLFGETEDGCGEDGERGYGGEEGGEGVDGDGDVYAQPYNVTFGTSGTAGTSGTSCGTAGTAAATVRTSAQEQALKRLQELELSVMSPLEALNLLYELQKAVRAG
ncbi:MAG: DNA mismatch repair protein MutS [Lachnospiraceae bacterium]|jgi:DNA mismatch repair protein MutS|nr:DNA mismatch repair protein MutS [Lachnospiraceae bacterium]